MTEDYKMFHQQLESLKDNNESNTFLTSNNVSNIDITKGDVNLSHLNSQYKNQKDISHIHIDNNISNNLDDGRDKISMNNTINKNSSLVYN